MILILTRELHDKFKDYFNCGNNRLNLFFNGSESLDNGVGVTYILVSDDNKKMIGYFNITTGMIIEAENINNRIGGSIHINCFALDVEYQGIIVGKNDEKDIKLSDIFFMQCIDIIKQLRTKIGFSFITLSSTNEGYNLYKRFGFEDCENDMIISEKYMSKYDCFPMYYSLDIDNY